MCELGKDCSREARRLARKTPFRGRREYVHVGCGKNIRVFHAPGKGFYDRSVAGRAGGMVALVVLSMSTCCLAADAAQSAGTAAASAAPQVTAQSQAGVTLGELMRLLA